MTLTSLEGEAARFASTADLEQLRPDLERLVAQAIDAVRACSAKPDDTFGDWGELVAAIRSTAFHEGMLLERAVARLALCNPNLLVVQLDKPMPIVPAAREILRRNDGPLTGIRLSPEVHARESYAPDIVIVDRARYSALILDIKRSLASYETRRLNDLRSRMMASAMIASDWLSIECRTPPVGDVAIAIIDGSDDAIDHDRGVWGLSEIGELLEINGAGAAMAMLRERFGQKVRQQGIAVPGTLSFGEEVEARVARIAPSSIADAARDLARRNHLEGMFLSCTNLRTLDIIDPLTQELGLPVLSSNQCLAWHMAVLSGSDCKLRHG